MKNLASRFPENPILRPGDLAPSSPDLTIECLLNPGVFEYDGRVWMLLRVAERPRQKEGIISFPINDPERGISIMEIPTDSPDLDTSDPRVINYKGNDYLTTLSYLRLVCSDDGVHFREPEGFTPIFGQGPYETYGIEDCRVTKIDDTFYLTYTAVSANGVAVGMMSTKNWHQIKRHGLILPPHNKDCALFGRPVNGKYYMFHRPSSPQIGGNYIWIASSPDLIHWGEHRCIARSRKGMWDSVRVGAGAAPIETPAGWLMIYHGADERNRYCLGAMLLDREDPGRVLARSTEPVMEPDMPYEQTGFFGNVVFTNGQIVRGDEITIYYGASDEVICGARLSVARILEQLGFPL